MTVLDDLQMAEMGHGRTRKDTDQSAKSLIFARGLLLLIKLPIVFLLLVACRPSGSTPEPAQILYLGWDEAGVVQLWRVGEDGTGAVALTAVSTDLFDFAPAPDGQTIAYSQLNGDGGSAIWQVDRNGRSPRQLLDCPTTLCTDLVWRPDGQRLLFEQRDSDNSLPTLWWLDVASGQTAPLLADNYTLARLARFSPAGDWVSYVSPTEEGVWLFNWTNGRSQFIPNTLGSPATWSPQGDSVIVSDHNLAVLHGGEGSDHESHGHDFNEAILLYRVDAATGERTPLTEALSVDDGAAAWSPDGAWVAFGRSLWQTAVGRQLWLVRPDGSEAHALTDEPLLYHGPPHWSSNGRLLLFQQSEVGGNGRSAIMTLDVATGEQRQVAAEGFQPAWLPPANK